MINDVKVKVVYLLVYNMDFEKISQRNITLQLPQSNPPEPPSKKNSSLIFFKKIHITQATGGDLT